MNFSHFLTRTPLLLIVSFFFYCPPLPAESSDVDLDAANRAYADGHYDDSALLFQEIIASRGYSAPLCFDLGNAEAKAGHLGLAILNYERARYLAPGESDIEFNLQLARKQAGLEPNPYRWWQVLLREASPTAGYLVVVCLALFILALVGNAVLASTKNPPPLLRLIFRIIFFVGIPVCFLLGFVEVSAIGLTNRIEGVIVNKDAILRLSPWETAESIGTMPEGELVTVERRHNDFFWIEARDHHFGWVQKKDLEPVVAGSFAVSSSD